MSFLQNHKVSFNQESLPITYHNFRHNNLVRPKNKSPNSQGSQPISYKANFSQKDKTHLADPTQAYTHTHTKKKTTELSKVSKGKLGSDSYLQPK